MIFHRLNNILERIESMLYVLFIILSIFLIKNVVSLWKQRMVIYCSGSRFRNLWEFSLGLVGVIIATPILAILFIILPILDIIRNLRKPSRKMGDLMRSKHG